MKRTNDTAPPCLIERVLETLHSRSMNNFKADALGDHALNTTMSSLRHRHGLMIENKWEKIESKRSRTYVKRYWLPKCEHEKAKRVLAQMNERHLNR